MWWHRGQQHQALERKAERLNQRLSRVRRRYNAVLIDVGNLERALEADPPRVMEAHHIARRILASAENAPDEGEEDDRADRRVLAVARAAVVPLAAYNVAT